MLSNKSKFTSVEILKLFKQLQYLTQEQKYSFFFNNYLD